MNHIHQTKDPALREDDGAAGAAGGGNIRGAHVAECGKHVVGVECCKHPGRFDDEDDLNTGKRKMWQLERRTDVISGEVGP